MAQFLTTHQSTAALEQIIREARSHVVLISPFMQLSRNWEERLLKAARDGVTIAVVCRDSRQNQDELGKLASLKNLQVAFMDNLHAKCYYNENRLIISSLNLYEHSERNNREMGVLLTREDDHAAFEDAMAEAEAIFHAAEPWSRTKQVFRSIARFLTGPEPARRTSRPAAARAKKEGACIRCGDGLPYRPTSPLCRTCYDSWAEWGNEDYEERFCHGCGEPHSTTKARPLCSDCFRERPFKPVRSRF